MSMTDDLYSAFGVGGQVAIVTGGTEGIGRGIADVLGRAHARVAVASRRQEYVDRAEEELRSSGVDALGVRADVTEEDQVHHLFDEVVARFGGVDILVNCAGGSFGATFKRAPLLELGPGDLIESYRLNVVAAFLCSTAAVPLMRARGSGSIVNVSSVGGESSGNAGMFAVYGSSKAALNHLSRSMAGQFAPEIRVNVIAPGLIDTPRTSASRTPERLEATLRRIALGRIGTPDDVALSVLFLVSRFASWMTGTNLRIDGGGGLVAGEG
jgi:7-alpha-hydroxysteroid dehydrogenase